MFDLGFRYVWGKEGCRFKEFVFLRNFRVFWGKIYLREERVR